ncbi:MAG: xanthine dehydrogenase family protein subunit M [Bacteroidales bacterium]|nr:xanthine dehydrogenase family protein subunit M [Bacteroidales bacterium]
MYLKEFKFYRPGTLSEALEMLSNAENGALKAGGTDLLVEMKKGLRSYSELISLTDLAELKEQNEDAEFVRLGAGLTHSEILDSELVRKYFPAFAEAVLQIGSDQVRNTGTLGGNLCTAAACCDSAPVLIALDAEVEMMNKKGTETIALKDFFVHNRRTVLKKDQILTTVVVKKCAPHTGVHFEKFGLRQGSAIAVVSVAALLTIEDGHCKDARIVIGAVAPTPLVSYNAINAIKGKKLGEFYEKSEIILAAGKAASEDSVPIDDVRGGAQFRRNVLNTLTQRAILTALRNCNMQNTQT